MSKEIKIKVWNPYKKLMYDGNKLEKLLTKKVIFVSLSYGKLIIYSYDKNGDYYELIPLQFTGLPDKNGNEIYEGDIIGTNERYQILPKYIVEWNEKHCCFTCIDGGTFNYIGDIDELIQYHLLSNMRLDVCEIIGNIHENSELLGAWE
jgi:uncharacterized phage protein (TIGR01671 family)